MAAKTRETLLKPTSGGAAAPASSKALTPEQAAKVDEYGVLEARMRAWKPNVNPHAQRFNQLRAEILTWCESDPAGENLILKGQRYTVPVSQRQNHRWVSNVLGFIRLLGGARKYAALVPPTLALVEEHVPKAERGKYISEELTGRRSVGDPVEHPAEASAA